MVRGASPRPISNPKWFDDNSNVGWLRISDVTEQKGRIHHLSQRISKAGQSKTRVIIEPHLLLSIAATVGSPVINYVNTGVHDGFLIFLNPTFDKEFMFQWLLMFKPYWNKYGQPGSQVNLNSDIVGNQSIAFPTTSEQERIANFFSELDTAITLHEEKKRQLERLKSALLKKMFADKSVYPAVRFKGFSDEWEQCKLGDISSSYSGGTPKAGTQKYYNGKIPFIRSGEISNGFTELTITEDGLRNSAAKMVGKGDILYALYGATSGEVSIARINGAINQAIMAIKPFEGYDSYLLASLLQNNKTKITEKYLQGGQGNLSATIVKNLELKVPSSKEQKLIGILLLRLDRSITLYEHKLELLKRLKCSLLQNMFI
ncbi:restriction endonuclease subunit S [Lactobacillus delbrueckii subsp. allosunkii]|uniref:restriction endonuclease subunit S n=1 Tax=Lactobacillus delbrueckii TaxID=1584 RepID=UPI003A89BFE8